MRRQIGLVLLGTLLSVVGCDRLTNSPHAAGAEQTNTFFTALKNARRAILIPLRRTRSMKRLIRILSMSRFIAFII